MLKTIEISDKADLEVSLLNYGARIHRLHYKGKDRALFYPELSDYLDDQYYLGCTIGPIANRLSSGLFQVSEQTFNLPKNEGQNSLHSGGIGFDKHIWSIEEQAANQVQLALKFDLDDFGAEGSIECIADYKLEANKLILVYSATPSVDCYLNMTNHVYLNIDGQSTIGNHRFRIFAKEKLLVDEASIPNGKTVPIDSQLDYKLGDPFSQYVDHHFNIDTQDGSGIRPYLQVNSEENPCRLQISGTSPGYQFYTGKFLDTPFKESAGFCLEPQLAPDAINQEGAYAPNTKAGSTFEQTIEWEFSD